MTRHFFTAIIVVAFLLGVSMFAYADRVVLKDGTVLEGTVIKRTEGYWVKLADGTSKTVPFDQVKEVIKGSGGSAAPTTPAAPSAPKPTAPTTPAKPNSAVASTPQQPAGTVAGVANRGTLSFPETKSRAERVEDPILAVSMWEKFIDANPTSTDLSAAKDELKKWQQLQKDNAERINGKWIGGEEKKKLLKKVFELIREGNEQMNGAGFIEGVKKIEEALKLYPQSFDANFMLGYQYLKKGAVGSTGAGNNSYLEKAVTSLEAAAKIRPGSAATWSNLAIGYNFRKKYEQSVLVAYKAVKIEDSKETVQNLVNSLAHAPPLMQTSNAKLKPIIEDAFILAQKHGIGREGGTWIYIPPRAPGEDPKGIGAPSDAVEDTKPGPVWMGSGFFVTEDGYFITNHHVAAGEPKAAVKKNIAFRVRFDDGTEKNAELIAVDDKADLALMKVKTDSPVPFLKIADDNPKQAAKALVLGYPATGEENPTMQISEGQVKSLHPGDEHEVWFDLNTTHGNSGGPIVDKNGRLIGVLTAGRTVYNVTYVLGVGPKQIDDFLKRLGDKSPKVQHEPVGTGEFDGEKLTEQTRRSTLLIIAIRTDGTTDNRAGVLVAKDDGVTVAAPASQPATAEEGKSEGEAPKSDEPKTEEPKREDKPGN